MRTTPLYLMIVLALPVGCHPSPEGRSCENKNSVGSRYEKGEYGYDLEFLQKFCEPVQLSAGQAGLIIVPEYQGRVMTSTSSGGKGISHGWLNYDLIASREPDAYANLYGGEERIWLGPEKGQFSVFYREDNPGGDRQWVVPAPLDREPFHVVKKDAESITLTRDGVIRNDAGTNFHVRITRTVTLLHPSDIETYLGIKPGPSTRPVAYQSVNTLKNTGNFSWTRTTGTLSVWMLSMLRASPSAIAILPYRSRATGRIVNDYFGNIPEERIRVTENAVFCRADGKTRYKTGIPAPRALPFTGSYDPDGGILSILEYSLPGNTTGYVNSMQEKPQKEPFSGDVVNFYNDGPGNDGSRKGRLYELETSSPAAFLKPGEEITHVQRMYHFQGKEKDLDHLSRSVFHVSLEEFKNALNTKE